MWMMAMIAMSGCGQKARTDALEAELEKTRRELVALSAEVERLKTPAAAADSTEPSEAPATESSGDSETFERALRRAVDSDLARVSSMANLVDQDLGTLEGAVADQAASLERVQAAVDDLTQIANNHADLLDHLGEDVLALDQDTQLTRDLRGLLSVDGRQIRIVDANLVLVQGMDASGKPKSNGQILTQPAVLRKAP